MHPTDPSWALVSWARRARARAAELPRARDKFAFYGLSKDNRHFIRLDPVGKGLLLSRQWAPSSAPVTWRVDRFHDETWRVPDAKGIQNYRPYEPLSIVVPGSAAPPAAPAAPPAPPSPGGWGPTARGWAGGAVALALLLLLVRVAENCLHKKLFKVIYMHTNVGAGEIERDMMRGHYHLHGVRRQESDEWPTPNVTATSQQTDNVEFVSVPRLEDSEAIFEPTHVSNDLPPPYSECSQPSSGNLNKYTSEEAPPPYSACYVSYNVQTDIDHDELKQNILRELLLASRSTHTQASCAVPKDDDPDEHMQNILRQHLLADRARSSIDIDNVQNVLIENGLGTDTVTTTSITIDFEETDSPMRTELVFDNGRIIERLTLDLISNHNETDTAFNHNEGSSRAKNFRDRVAYIDIDDDATENIKPENVLLV